MSEDRGYLMSRREALKVVGGTLAVAAFPTVVQAQAPPAPASGPQPGDRVFLTNEDSNTLSVIDPMTDQVAGTVNLTSFDEDYRPPFRFVTGGVVPTHGAMIQKPLYHGAISIHGCVPSPDSSIFATVGRGSSNLYLVDIRTLKVIGNQPNPLARADANPEVVTSGVFIGREPHEPTFTRTGKEIWVALRGENRIVVLDVELAKKESEGTVQRGSALKRFIPTVPGPAMVWFSADGKRAFVASQKVSKVDVFDVSYDADGASREARSTTLDIQDRDKFAFSPFLRLSGEGDEIWMSHKIADAVSVLDARGEPRVLETISMGQNARPNHIEFARNARGTVAYVSFARIDDDGPNGVASSRVAIVDRSAPVGTRRVVDHFFSHGRESHGVWTDPSASKLYVAHEGDELPGTPNAGQTVCSAFDITDPFKPRFLTQIPLGDLVLPSGRLRNKKSINLVYVRPGAPSATA